MNKVKYSKLSTLLAIVSAAIIIIGMAVGTLCHFIADGFFNYGGEYTQYNSVTVNYLFIDNDQEEVAQECKKQFADNGVSYYEVTFADTNQGGEIVYKFAKNVDVEKIENAITAINASLSTESNTTPADLHKAEVLLGGSSAFIMGSIAIASCIAFHAIYMAIRFKLSMALSAFVADLHNVALFAAVMALTRLPVSASTFTFGVFTVVATMIATCILFGRMRKNFATEDYKKLTSFEQVDGATAESSKSIIAFTGITAVALAIFEILTAITAPSFAVVTPLVCGIVATLCVLYGTLFFTPATYAPLKAVADKKTNKK